MRHSYLLPRQCNKLFYQITKVRPCARELIRRGNLVLIQIREPAKDSLASEAISKTVHFDVYFERGN